MWVKTIFWSLCYPRLRDSFNVHFMQEHRKLDFFICGTTTVGLFWCIIIILKFHVPSRDFFLQSFIVYESAEDRNLRGFFNRVKNSLPCNILPNSIVTGMPYLPAKDELVSLNRLSSRGLWKWYNSKVLDRRLYGWGSILLFAGFLQKENSLEALIVVFENVSPKGFFWLNMKDFEISVLTANSRYLQTAAVKLKRSSWKPRGIGEKNLLNYPN